MDDILFQMGSFEVSLVNLAGVEPPILENHLLHFQQILDL